MVNFASQLVEFFVVKMMLKFLKLDEKPEFSRKSIDVWATKLGVAA